MSSPTLVLYFCLHKCDKVFLFILSRTKGTFTRETERENQSCTISVNTRTPLCHFPLFGFGLLIEFEDVQRLANGHAEHPPEFFYTGSLWKYGSSLFFFVHIYIDPRDKVTARHRLICPSKRKVIEVMLFGDFKQRGILLTKAPKVLLESRP
ncbi:BnaA04g15680D [Brassica napus]|uniref:BnaA04g15680D protein n=1 Tax=Brassica napus TaxID=3708 RepID=A0A078GVS5_BRANA|nr:BnaA04g15680D [Brassica napus]